MANFSACNTNELPQDFPHKPKAPQYQNTASFFNSVDSLNNEFNLDASTRAPSGWGALTYAVDGILGFVGGACTSGFGGFLIGSVASEAYARYGDYVEKKLNSSSIINVNDDLIPKKFDTPTTTAFVGNVGTTSLGVIHNHVLTDLAYSTASYIDINGNVAYNELLEDCCDSLKKYDVDCSDLLTDQTQKKNIVGLLDVSIKTFTECGQGSISFDESFEILKSEILKRYGDVPNFDFEMLKDMEKKLSILPLMHNDSIYNYATKLNKIIEDSKLTTSQKSDVKQICDISVNSALYWNAVNEVSK